MKGLGGIQVQAKDKETIANLEQLDVNYEKRWP